MEEQEKIEKKDKKKKNKSEMEVEILKQQVIDLQNKLMYQQAELINYRKRTDERIQELLKYKNEDLLLDLTDMIENLNRASSVKVESEESKKIQTGIMMVNEQFKQILKKYDVVAINALGLPFNSNYMDAMILDNDESKPDDMVTAVLQTGYMYKGRVLKHAQVKVNKIEEKKGND